MSEETFGNLKWRGINEWGTDDPKGLTIDELIHLLEDAKEHFFDDDEEPGPIYIDIFTSRDHGRVKTFSLPCMIDNNDRSISLWGG